MPCDRAVPDLSVRSSRSWVIGVRQTRSSTKSIWIGLNRSLYTGHLYLSLALNRTPFADLLSPHCEVQTLLCHELIVPSRLDDAAALQHVDAIGVQHGRQT